MEKYKNIIIAFITGIIMFSCTDSKPDLIKATIMAHDFVKEKLFFPEEAEFKRDRIGSETSDNEYDIIQSFTAKNAFGVKISYKYKIHTIFHGGEWTDINNWSYTTLSIENTSTGEKEIFYGK